MADFMKAMEFVKSNEGMHISSDMPQSDEIVLCSNCFLDEGLKLESLKIGLNLDSLCPNCHTNDGRKLSKVLTLILAKRFFVEGTRRKGKFGINPIIEFNQYQYKKSDINFQEWIKNDVKLIAEVVKIGFFHYGPRLWMLGQIEPLKSLVSKEKRKSVVEQIIRTYPKRILSLNETFYRLRKNPKNPSMFYEFDSPPNPGGGRLDSDGLSIMYASQDMEVCVHECRATIEDDLYVATLSPEKELKLIDLTELIEEENVNEFNSMDLAMQMLFFAKDHSYEISRHMSFIIKEAGYDGIIYPSYFSMVRTGANPFETIMGLSIRRFKHLKEQIKSQTIQNIALFGKPIQEKIVKVKCINRVILKQVLYDLQFGTIV